jgi:hypothetical protein
MAHPLLVYKNNRQTLTGRPCMLIKCNITSIVALDVEFKEDPKPPSRIDAKFYFEWFVFKILNFLGLNS